MTAIKPEDSADKAPAPNGKHRCPECDAPVEQPRTGRARIFCNEAHKQAHANRRAVRGKSIMSLLQAWRVDRGRTPVAREAFAAMVEMVDTFNSEDLDQGRGRANVHARHLLDQGNYRDRRSVHLVCTKGFQGCERRSRAPFNCGYLEEARRHAREAGWIVERGNETCPNCRDDNKLENREAGQ